MPVVNGQAGEAMTPHQPKTTSDAKRLSRQLLGMVQQLEHERVRDKAARGAALLDAAQILADYDRVVAELARLRVHDQSKAA